MFEEKIIVDDIKYKVYFKFAFLDNIYYACKFKQNEAKYTYIRINDLKDEYIIEKNNIVIERLNEKADIISNS